MMKWFAAIVVASLVSGCSHPPEGTAPGRPMQAEQSPSTPSTIAGLWGKDEGEFHLFFEFKPGGALLVETISKYDTTVQRGSYKLAGKELRYELNGHWDGARWVELSGIPFTWEIRIQADKMEVLELGSSARTALKRYRLSEVNAIRTDYAKHQKANAEQSKAAQDAMLREFGKP